MRPIWTSRESRRSGSISGPGGGGAGCRGPPLIPPVSRPSEHRRALVRERCRPRSPNRPWAVPEFDHWGQGFLALDAWEFHDDRQPCISCRYPVCISVSYCADLLRVDSKAVSALPKIPLSLSRWLSPTRAAALTLTSRWDVHAWRRQKRRPFVRRHDMIGQGRSGSGAPHFLLHALAAAAGLHIVGASAALYDISFQLSYVSVWVWRWRCGEVRRRRTAPVSTVKSRLDAPLAA